MVAELKAKAAKGLLLLMEPDRPPEGASRKMVEVGRSGWRIDGYGYAREHAHDAHGAVIQHAIVRYLVHGVQRQQIAQEVHYSERQVQAWISGRVCRSYAEPVRRALGELGIGMGRGGISEASSRRGTEVVAACMALLADVPWYMDDDWPRQREIKELARLLTAGREPLG